MKKLIFKLILISFSLGFTDLMAGFLYRRITGYAWAERHAGLERTYRVPSKIFHHGLAPNIKMDKAVWGHLTYKIRTNSLGLKDREPRTVDLKSPGNRILFIGDSFTEGVGYSYEETFVGRIADALAEEKIDVLNAGVSSYCPIIYWRKIQHLIEDENLEVDEVVVYIDISDTYDETGRYLLTPENTVGDLNPPGKATGLKGLLNRNT
ncbi:MAG: hypothetical protein AAF492_19775, partial [Verrucomicrobiota bacterium]